LLQEQSFRHNFPGDWPASSERSRKEVENYLEARSKNKLTGLWEMLMRIVIYTEKYIEQYAATKQFMWG